jgi:putative endonuclease
LTPAATDCRLQLRANPREWLVYIIRCVDGSLYTGITTDLERRFRQHAAGTGAKYLRGRQPLQLVYREGGHTRSSAAQREARIKRLAREEKERLVATVGQHAD